MIERGAWVAAAVVFLGLGALTVVRVPTIPGWWMALLATEFGHWLAPLALVLAAGAAARGLPGGRSWVHGAAAVGLAGGAVLLLRPLATALAMEGRVRTELETSLGVPASAQGGALVRLSGLFAGAPAPPRRETHVYARGEGYALELDLRRPAVGGGGERAPVILLVHGGGWNGGSRDELPRVADWLAARGWAVASIDYRLAPRWRWPAPREDVRRALGWLREHAPGLGLDADRVVLFGRSAGAQIALAAAYDPATGPVRGVVALYGPADMHFGYEHGEEDDVLKSRGLIRDYMGGPPGGNEAAYDDASPIRHVRADLPPTLLVHGRLDTLVWVRQSERLAARLAEAGARHYFLSLPWATHAFDFNLRGPGGQLALGAVERFLATAGGARDPG